MPRRPRRPSPRRPPHRRARPPRTVCSVSGLAYPQRRSPHPVGLPGQRPVVGKVAGGRSGFDPDASHSHRCHGLAVVAAGRTARRHRDHRRPGAAPGHACDVTLDVVGTIQTDGRGGVVTYQWLRNDGETSAVLREILLPGRDEAVVHLHWALTGQGTFHATATLSVLAPDPVTATTELLTPAARTRWSPPSS